MLDIITSTNRMEIELKYCLLKRSIILLKKYRPAFVKLAYAIIN